MLGNWKRLTVTGLLLVLAAGCGAPGLTSRAASGGPPPAEKKADVDKAPKPDPG